MSESFVENNLISRAKVVSSKILSILWRITKMLETKS